MIGNPAKLLPVSSQLIERYSYSYLPGLPTKRVIYINL